MSAAVEMIKGSLVALVTPMHTSGEIDFDNLSRLIDWHIEHGSDGLVITGTTGESPTLDHNEHIEVIGHSIKVARSRLPIIAGVGSNSTREAIDLSRRAHDLGADACLQVAPYYNRPPQAGLIAHFAAIANAVPAAHILYNVPARTGVDILPDTVAALAQIDNIVGVKEASGDVGRARQLCADIHPNRADFRLYAGEDAVAVDLMTVGAVGCISVTANLTPEISRRVFQAALDKDFDQARELDARLSGLHQALFVQANPIPVKWALRQMGLIEAGIRLPLIELDAVHHRQLVEALASAGISVSQSS